MCLSDEPRIFEELVSGVEVATMSPQLSHREILERAEEARKLSSPCGLCPRLCRVDRQAGERGYCGAGPLPTVAAALPHFGEEPPLTGSGGAGTIFFSHCNMACVYCQNFQISQAGLGSEISPVDLAVKMLELQRAECANIEPVSPSPHLPGLLEALASAVEKGLHLPIAYNTNGYETRETLDILDGIVDIYVPDLKYSSAAAAASYSDTPDYVETSRAATLQMHSQVGNLVVNLYGAAVRGLIVRHLALPENIAGTAETLSWLRDNLPQTITISLMAQYAPLYRSAEFPPLDRKLTREEYDQVVDMTWDMGFDNVFIQDMDSPVSGIPDFREDRPFNWE
jgi:putative pyruvate formate lyase activating enzyme